MKEQEKKYCKNCKAELDENDAFCKKCGKKVRKELDKKTKIVTAIILIFIIIGAISSNSGDKEKLASSSESKWNKYYEQNKSEIIEMNQDTFYTYGKYFANKTVLTVVEVKSISSSYIKAKSSNNDSLMHSFVFNFKDENIRDLYDEEEVVAIFGKVSDKYSSSWKTITLNDCHVIASGDKAKKKKEELENNKDSQEEYAKTLENNANQQQSEKTMNEKSDYINNCQYVDYNDVLRNPNNYKERKIRIDGKVIQVINGWGKNVTFRVQDASNQVWYITYKYNSDNEPKILENDNVSIYGVSSGTTSYTTVLGSQITIPSIKSKYIDVN